MLLPILAGHRHRRHRRQVRLPQLPLQVHPGEDFNLPSVWDSLRRTLLQIYNICINIPLISY